MRIQVFATNTTARDAVIDWQRCLQVMDRAEGIW